MMLLLILCILVIPWLLGRGILYVFYAKKQDREFCLWDAVIAGVILVIGLGEAAHLCTLFLHKSFSVYTVILGVLTAAVSLAAAGVVFFARIKGKNTGEGTIAGPAMVSDGTRPGDNVALYVVPLALFGIQMAYILLGSPYLQGDMTVETILSFLQSDGLYQVNPMTGSAYEGGIPLRLKILGLPSLYGGLCRFFTLHPQIVVWALVPCVTLACCYGAFCCLGRCLFPENLKKRCCFVTLVGLLLWAGNYAMGMDGFGVLNSGWRGTVIRNVVLIPWLISLCLRKKWKLVVLCIAAEACMVWTFYGAGACLFTATGFLILDWAVGKVTGKGRREAAR